MSHAVSPLARFAMCAAIAVAFGIGTPLHVAAADAHVVGQVTLSLDSGDWSFGIRAGAEQGTSQFENTMLPLADFTAQFSGPGARFEALHFNGLPAVMRELVLYAADGAEDTGAGVGVQWEYVALGVAGAAAAVLVISAALAKDAADEIVDDIFDD